MTRPRTLCLFLVLGLLLRTMLLPQNIWADKDAPCPQKEPKARADLVYALNRSDRLLKKGRFEKALTELEKYRQTHPTGHHLLAYQQGLVWLGLKKPEKAVTFFQEAVRLYPCFGPGWQNLAVAHLDSDHPIKAAEALEQAFELTRPKNPDLKFQAAALRLRAGQIDRATKALTELTEGTKPKPEWFLALAKAFQALEAPDRAADVLEKSVATFQKNSDDLTYQAAVLRLKARQLEQALALMEPLARKKAPQREWLLTLARTQDDLDRPRDAAQTLEDSARLFPENQGEDLFRAFGLFQKAGDEALALAALQKAVRSPKAKPGWLLALARLQADRGETKALNQSAIRLLKKQPDQAVYWRLAAAGALEANRLERAAAALEIAGRLTPLSSDELQTLGEIYLKAGVPSRAAEIWRQCFGPDPNPEQLDLLAGAWQQAGRLDSALEPARKAAQNAPTGKRWAVVARLYLLQRNYGLARTAFEQAAALEDPEGLYSLKAGQCAFRTGDWAQARYNLEQALRQAPAASENAREGKKLLQALAEWSR